MIKRTFHAAITAMVLATPLQAQTAQDLAAQYVAMPEIQQMMADMFAPEAMAQQFASGLPAGMQISAEQSSAIGTLLSGVMNDIKPKMEDLMREGTARHFSVDEIKALMAFYSSEHGASIMTKMQPFFQEIMGQLQPAINQNMQSVMPKIVEILQGK